MKVTPVSKRFGKYAVGDQFDLPDAAAKMLIRAKILTAVDEVEISAITGKPKRQYRRRDMVAE